MRFCYLFIFHTAYMITFNSLSDISLSVYMLYVVMKQTWKKVVFIKEEMDVRLCSRWTHKKTWWHERFSRNDEWYFIGFFRDVVYFPLCLFVESFFNWNVFTIRLLHCEWRFFRCNWEGGGNVLFNKKTWMRKIMCGIQ